MATVPKGFLRYNVLRLLSEKPMSGSEIVSELWRRTDGRWKPGPGSIYPLLEWLREKGYAKEIPGEEAGIKRYALTDKGKAFLQEHVNREEEFRNRFGFLMPPFPGLFWFDFHPKEVHELVKAGENLVAASWNLLDALRVKYSEEAIANAKEVMEQAAQKIEEIAKRLEEADEG
jgi:DNA-binding PadR family transcriptional regulator